MNFGYLHIRERVYEYRLLLWVYEKSNSFYRGVFIFFQEKDAALFVISCEDLTRDHTTMKAWQMYAQRKELLQKYYQGKICTWKALNTFFFAQQDDYSVHGHDLFAINMYYHQSCYLKFTLSPILWKDQQQNNCTQDVFDEFYGKNESKILHQKMHI